MHTGLMTGAQKFIDTSSIAAVALEQCTFDVYDSMNDAELQTFELGMAQLHQLWQESLRFNFRPHFIRMREFKKMREQNQAVILEAGIEAIRVRCEQASQLAALQFAEASALATAQLAEQSDLATAITVDEMSALQAAHDAKAAL